MERILKWLWKYLYIGGMVGLVLSAIFIGLEALADGGIQWNGELLEDFINHMLHAIILTALNGTLFNFLHERDVFRKPSALKILGSLLASIALTVLGIFLARAIYLVGLKGMDWPVFLARQRLVNYVIGILITLVVTLFFHVMYFYKEWQDKKVRVHKQMAGTASARFEALKNQLDPHFLFNSLNVLSSLIEEDSRQAQKFTTSLSKVYRYVLEQKNKDLVTLEDELSFARTYARLLTMRFEDSLEFRLPDKVRSPKAKMVPLSLQLLLENAVKHNEVSGQKPLTIEVLEEDNRLVVRNNLQEKQTVSRGSGVGLKNIRQRYQLLTPEPVEITKEKGIFSVTLPLLGEEVEIENVPNSKEYLSKKRYEKAREKVEELRGFYSHLASFLLVIPILWVLNYGSQPDFLWAIFPTLGWGFGLTRHAMRVFEVNILWGKEWQERKIRELMEKDDF